MTNGITRDNLLHTAPSVLANDANMSPLVSTLAYALEKMAASADIATLYPNIDSMPESMLDILAKDFDVYWYNYGWTVEQKRESIKNAGYVHRHAGTNAAVVSALTAVYPSTILQEWFQYGGEPYHFRIITSGDPENQDWYNKVIELVLLMKNARSVLDSICASFEARLTLSVEGDAPGGLTINRASDMLICGGDDL